MISICIPAYKRINYLERLLNSIQLQNFKDFEVIISDDSDDDSVKILLERFKDKFELSYFKNQTALGTPANWNHAISKCKGEWIKLVHDDDFFSNENSLEKFAELTKNGKKFIFSGYNNYYEFDNHKELEYLKGHSKKSIIKHPNLLLAKNLIGPPSVTLIHKSILEKYDERLKWRVDLEFYIRVINIERDFSFTKEPLMNVGISPSQVTNACINIPEVEIPEANILLQKFGTQPLRNIKVYDAYWRILRNTKIRSLEKLNSYGMYNWPDVILNMVNLQSKINLKVLKIGVLSKSLMLLSYLYNRLKRNI